MTIDERIEALTMNLELLSRDLESFRETSRETMAQLAQQMGQQMSQLVTAVTTRCREHPGPGPDRGNSRAKTNRSRGWSGILSGVAVIGDFCQPVSQSSPET